MSDVVKPSQVYIKYRALGLEINGEKISKCVFTVPIPECEERLFSGWQLKIRSMLVTILTAYADHSAHHLRTEMLEPMPCTNNTLLIAAAGFLVIDSQWSHSLNSLISFIMYSFYSLSK